MAAHVTSVPAAESDPACATHQGWYTPLLERSCLRDTDPLVPFQRRWHRIGPRAAAFRPPSSCSRTCAPRGSCRRCRCERALRRSAAVGSTTPGSPSASSAFRRASSVSSRSPGACCRAASGRRPVSPLHRLQRHRGSACDPGTETFTESMSVPLLLEQLAPVLIDAGLREALPGAPRSGTRSTSATATSSNDGCVANAFDVGQRLSGRSDTRVAQRRPGRARHGGTWTG